MTKRFFLGLLFTIAYFALGLLLCIMVRHYDGDKASFPYLFIGFLVGLGGLIHIIRTRLFLFTPKNGRTAVSLSRLLSTVKSTKLAGCQFQVHEDGNTILLTPDDTNNHTGCNSSQPHQTVYGIKLIVDARKNCLQCTDRLLPQAEGETLETVLSRFTDNCGFAHLRFTYRSQHGKTLTMNNSCLHQALANLVTDNGWALNLKIF